MPVVESVDEVTQLPQAETAAPEKDTTLDETAAAEKETSESKSDGSANNSLENMESLLINEDEDDDPIGSESLRLSGSEDDEDGEKVSPVLRKKPTKKILNSDDEGETQKGAKKVEIPKEQENKVEDKTSEELPKKPKKFSALIDSNSEPEETPEEEEPKRILEPIDSDNDKQGTGDEEKKENLKKPRKKKKDSAKSKSKDSKSKGSANEDGTEESSQSKRRKKKSKVSDLIDSDSERSMGSDGENEKLTNQENEEGGPGDKPKKKQRASAKKAIDEMQAIQSETQRLYRETQVSIPYHKPKRLTLKEFLNRRTIVQPQVTERGFGKKLKMSAEELEEYAKHLEERAKEATEFFKSESEDELEDMVKDDDEQKKTSKEIAITETPVAVAMEVEESSEVRQTMEVEEFEKWLDQEVPSAPTTQELLDIEIPQGKVPESEQIPSTSMATKEKEPTPSTSRSAVVAKSLTEETESIPSTSKSVVVAKSLTEETESIPSTSKSVVAAKSLTEETEQPSTSKSAVAKSLSDLKRRLIAEKNLPPIPTLKGDPNMLIDLETGDLVPPKPTGLESLFERFVKSNVNNKKKPKDALSASSTENVLLDITKIKISTIEEPNKEKEPKPGAAYVKLKESLRSLITKKRKQDFQKKIEENQEEEEEYKKCCGLDDDEEEEREEDELERRSKKMEKDIVIDDEENEIEDLEDEDEEEACDNVDEEQDYEDAEAVDENGDKYDDDEKEVDDEEKEEDEAEDKEDEVYDDENEEDDSESDEEDEEENADQSARKHRIIKAFEDSDNENDEVDAGLNVTSTSVLFAEEENKCPDEVESELLGLCSGQFEATQRESLISQIPITQTVGTVDETELMDLCSGVFNDESRQHTKEVAEEPQKTTMKILSSDEEKEQEEEESASDVKKVKKLKKKRKKRAKLGFSDDEDEDEEEPAEEDSYDEEEVTEEIPETFIDYDSEENEIEVQMSKKECVKQATAFLEKEAELSESEWGSADEDEKNMDKYEMELGDEDEFDKEKIHTELEQIHMRKVLDDDIREVKKIQDMLFDNEEEDGVGRQRQFRWKNIESGFSLDDPAGGGDGNDENVDRADDEEEIQWRKMRFDREQLLQQKTKEEILAEVSATTLGKSLLATIEPDIKNKLEFKREEIVAREYKKPSFLIAQKNTKLSGSLLNCDDETLKRIAAFANKAEESDDEEQMQTKARRGGNFVFAPLTEEEKARRKRKAEKIQEAKNRNEAKIENVAKKPKLNTYKPLLLDRLL